MFNCPRLTVSFTRLFPNFGFKIITELSSPEDLPCLESDKLSTRPLHHAPFPGNSNAFFATIFAESTQASAPKHIASQNQPAFEPSFHQPPHPLHPSCDHKPPPVRGSSAPPASWRGPLHHLQSRPQPAPCHPRRRNFHAAGRSTRNRKL